MLYFSCSYFHLYPIYVHVNFSYASVLFPRVSCEYSGSNYSKDCKLLAVGILFYVYIRRKALQNIRQFQ